MTSPPAPSSTAALLRQRPFLLFWGARFATILAAQAQAVTIAWQVYAVARIGGATVKEAAFDVGMIGLAQFIPLFLLTLISGEVADRYDRRIICAICLGVEAVSAATLAYLAWSGSTALWPIFTVAAAFGSARAFYNPASTAMGPMLVPRDLLPRAIAWNSLAWQGASIAGPALGGLLCALSSAISYEVSLGLYLVSAVGLLLININTKTATQPGSRIELIKEGLAYVWSNKIVFGAISLDLFAVLLGGATALMPVYARDVLHVGAEGFGVLRAGPAIGATIVAIALTVRPIKHKAGIFMFTGVAIFAVATLVFAVSKSMTLSVAALAILGGADMLSVYIRQTLIQIVTPDVMRGRVAAVSVLFIGASNELGEFESGVVARLIGPIGAALFGGWGALIVTGTWAWLFPALRKADRLE